MDIAFVDLLKSALFVFVLRLYFTIAEALLVSVQMFACGSVRPLEGSVSLSLEHGT